MGWRGWRSWLNDPTSCHQDQINTIEVNEKKSWKYCLSIIEDIFVSKEKGCEIRQKTYAYHHNHIIVINLSYFKLFTGEVKSEWYWTAHLLSSIPERYLKIPQMKQIPKKEEYCKKC